MYKSKQYYATHPGEYIQYLKEYEKERKAKEEKLLNLEKEKRIEQYKLLENKLLVLKDQYNKTSMLNIGARRNIHQQIKETKDKMSLLNL